jgi:hypothetical protein
MSQIYREQFLVYVFCVRYDDHNSDIICIDFNPFLLRATNIPTIL